MLYTDKLALSFMVTLLRIIMLTLVHAVGAAPEATYDPDAVDQLDAVLKLSVAEPFTKKLPVPAQYNVGVDPQATLVAVVADPDKGEVV